MSMFNWGVLTGKVPELVQFCMGGSRCTHFFKNNDSSLVQTSEPVTQTTMKMYLTRTEF